MSKQDDRMAAFAALLAVLLLLVLLVRRGMVTGEERELSPVLVWREADDADLF